MAIGKDGTPYDVRVLGRISVVQRQGDADPKEADLQQGQQQLLAMLVAAGPGGATTAHLADEIWGDRLPERWKSSLRVAVSRLRSRTGLSVPSAGGRYTLDLSTTSVDAWHLLELSRQGGPWLPEMGGLLTDNSPFAGVELSPSLLGASAALTSARHDLIERLAADGRAQPRPLREQLIAHTVNHVTDERLVLAVATILLNSGAAAAAVGLIDRCRDELKSSLDAALSPELNALVEKVRSEKRSIRPEVLPRSRRILPNRLERYRRDRLVGRSDEVAELLATVERREPTVSIITGAPGSGKTTLVAEVAGQALRGHHVVHITGAAGGEVGLGPLSAAVDGFSRHIESVNAMKLDSAGRLGLLATRLVTLIGEQAAGLPVLMVIDDAHWLDSATCNLVAHLARNDADRAFDALIIAARPIHGPTAWRDLEQSLSQGLPVTNVEVSPLCVDDVAELIGLASPELSLAARHQAAGLIHDASAGLPSVVLGLIELGVDFDHRVALGLGEPGGDDAEQRHQLVVDRIISNLDPKTRAVGVAGAVLGRSFRLPDLAELVPKRSEASLLDAVEELIAHDIVVETGSLDHFEFAHQLLVDGLLRSATRSRRARLHLSASRLTDSPHALARHLVASDELTEQSTTLEAVVASARLHLAEHAFLESVAAFRTAIGLADVGLDTSVYVDFARALSLSGARSAAQRVRQQAFEIASAADDWNTAMDAAYSGLPEAEVPDGEVSRLEQLEMIPPAQLTDDRRFLRALTATRLASQLGRPKDAAQWATIATRLAADDDQAAEAALSRRFASTVELSPKDRLAQLDKDLDGLTPSPHLLCRGHQFRTIDSLELGDFAAAIDQFDRFTHLAEELGEPLRLWHASIFKSLVELLRGNLTRSSELADEALAIGRRHGIANADVVRLAQHGFQMEAVGRLGELADVIDLIPLPDGDSLLFQAARIRVLRAAGRKAEALPLAVELAEQVLAVPSVTSHGVLALLAPTLADHPKRELKTRVLAALEPFRAGHMVLGVGLGLLASVDLLCNSLTDGPKPSREASLGAAIEACDRQGYVVWSVQHRLELARLTGADQPRDEARRLALGTDLQTLFDDDGIAA